jgi:hypothetical protein
MNLKDLDRVTQLSKSIKGLQNSMDIITRGSSVRDIMITANVITNNNQPPMKLTVPIDLTGAVLLENISTRVEALKTELKELGVEV